MRRLIHWRLVTSRLNAPVACKVRRARYLRAWVFDDGGEHKLPQVMKAGSDSIGKRVHPVVALAWAMKPRVAARGRRRSSVYVRHATRHIIGKHESPGAWSWAESDRQAAVQHCSQREGSQTPLEPRLPLPTGSHRGTLRRTCDHVYGGEKRHLWTAYVTSAFPRLLDEWS
jgi:hypothetical protein